MLGLKLSMLVKGLLISIYRELNDNFPCLELFHDCWAMCEHYAIKTPEQNGHHLADDILSAFRWQKQCVSLFKFYWSLFLMVQSTSQCQTRSRNTNNNLDGHFEYLNLLKCGLIAQAAKVYFLWPEIKGSSAVYIVGDQVTFSWFFIHGSSWSCSIKAGPGQKCWSLTTCLWPEPDEPLPSNLKKGHSLCEFGATCDVVNYDTRQGCRSNECLEVSFLCHG